MLECFYNEKFGKYNFSEKTKNIILTMPRNNLRYLKQEETFHFFIRHLILRSKESMLGI